jgi:hypothetical protein
MVLDPGLYGPAYFLFVIDRDQGRAVGRVEGLEKGITVMESGAAKPGAGIFRQRIAQEVDRRRL